MPIITPEAQEAARQHAIDEYPNESCGLIQNDTYFRCKNVHGNPTQHFRIDPRTMAAAHKRGYVQAIIHSHPGGPFFPSESDMQGQLDSKIAWGITISGHDSASKLIMWGGDTIPAPLIGRVFIHGIQDCYSLARDYYKMKLDIDLLDMAREDNWWTSETANKNFYANYYDRVGFVKVDEPQEHDLILMKIIGSVANHVAVYTGGDTLIHHLAGRLSCEEVGVMRWSKFIVGYYRHKSLITNKESVDVR
ncbi:MAG: hypothetical protein EOO77_39705 [Oxalobacteraceae bacterium]|nr:MAG: hypothetical protein EOO77_39705 [Oxalobacteraceae bacterium]